MRVFLSVVFVMGAISTPEAGSATLEIVGISGAKYVMNVTSLMEARFQSTIRQQFDFSCGSAALATLLTHHYGYPITEQSVFEEMFSKGDQEKIRKEGFSLLDMKSYLNAHNFQGDGFEFPLEKLIESGLPAIVLISEKSYKHFVVIKGMRDGRILLGDPSSGTRAVTRSHFQSLWVNRFLFVIHNRQDQALFNSFADWRVAPRSPLTQAVSLGGLTTTTLTKLGPSDF